ncbi:MAG: hypothetical protein H7Y07_04210, partial [Pyrinomonadaceae bacterium]|nr:hypothetical protein [Sphingobacteriaceae bacterium]
MRKEFNTNNINFTEMGKTNATKKGTGKGLKFQRYFSKEGVDVYDLFQYEKRSSVIRNPAGDAVFE